MQNSARSQNMIPKLIETNILKTKLFMVDGKFDESYKLLEESHLLSQQQNLKYWSKVIQSEKDRFQIEIQEMENLFTLSSHVRQRLKKSDIFDYFQEAKKMILESDLN